MTVKEKLEVELNELSEKIGRLETGLSNGTLEELVSGTQYQLLTAQLQAMKTYAVILRARIKDLVDGNNEAINK